MKFLFLFLLLPFQMFAQDITGVWTGTLFNPTTKQFIKYELAISEYEGKLSGYSHTIFIIDSVENIGVKSVKIKKSGDDYFIEDEKLIYNNYPEPPAKGVRTFSKVSLSENDSAMILKGEWKTNQTSQYKSITGDIELYKKKEIQKTLIISKLEELGVAKSLSFINNSDNSFASSKDRINSNGSSLQNNQTSADTLLKETESSSPNTTKAIDHKEIKDVSLNENTSKVNSISSSKATGSLKTKEKIKSNNSTNKSISQSQAEIAKIHFAAADIESRTIETVKSVNIKSDSLILTLYDNGEIDGDTVSVLLNGKVIMPLQGLTAKGNSKTVYLTPEMGDSLQIIMYAENLGSIPPNTGLLVVHDGSDAYEIRFSGDLQKNAAIILRRNKK